MSDKIWLVRRSRVSTDYAAYRCESPVQPDDIVTGGVTVPAWLLELLRPDLVLPPGGGPVEVDELDGGNPQIVIAYGCGQASGKDALKAMMDQRDALLAAVEEAYPQLVCEGPPAPDHVCGNPDSLCDCSCSDYARYQAVLEKLRKAIAACEEKP